MSNTDMEQTLEQRAMKALVGVTMMPGSWAKRFVRNLPVSGEGLTEKQRYWLMKTTHMFRKQIRDKSIVEAAQLWLAANKEPA